MMKRLQRSRIALIFRERCHSLIILVCLATLLAGCAKEAVTVTTIPKERENTTYLTPSHWREQPGSAMRAATFTIQDEHGHNGEVSILPMPRMPISDMEIVNLWRQQVGLSPVTEEQVPNLSEKVNIGQQEGSLFDLVSPDAQTDPDHAPRIMTAYLHDETMTWFFKLTGPNHIVETEEPAFRTFLASVDLRRLERDFQRRRAAQAPPPSSRTSAPQLPEWEIPASWTSGTPSSSMLLASFSINNQVDGPAEVTVSSLGGGAGGLLANVNRWRGQIGLSAVQPDELSSISQTLDLGEQTGTLVDMTGTEKRIVAAIVPVAGQTWFYKMMGSPATVSAEIEAFTAFVQSVRYSGDG